MQVSARSEDWRLAGAELLRLHLVGVEIVADVLTDPNLLALLDPDIAIGIDSLGGIVNEGGVGREDRAGVRDAQASRGGDQTVGYVGRDFPLARRARDDFPSGFRRLLGITRPGPNQQQQCHANDRTERSHAAG